MTITNSRNASAANPASTGHRSRSRRTLSPSEAARRAKLKENVLSYLVCVAGCFLTMHIALGIAGHLESQRAQEAAQTQLLREILEVQSAQN